MHNIEVGNSGSYDSNQTMLATPFIVLDPLWYPDSAANHHLTYDEGNLSFKNEYTRADKSELEMVQVWLLNMLDNHSFLLLLLSLNYLFLISFYMCITQ